MKKRIFVAGKWSSRTVDNAFISVEAEVRKQKGDDVEVLLPYNLTNKDADWQTSERIDIATLASCDELHMTREWQSKEANLLRDIAMRLDMNIVYHN